jgi:SAM-dependent methyltransferase
MEDKDPAIYQKSLASGREIYREKHCGLDAWDDIKNFEYTLLSPIDAASFPGGTLRSLCVDVRCGTPVLEIRNRLRKRGLTDIKSFAFTTLAKYYLDLLTAGAEAECDRAEFIQSKYADNTFNIIALGEPLNNYNEPVTLLQRLYNFTKPGGLLLFKLRNTDDYRSLLRAAGLSGQSDPDIPACIPINDIAEILRLFGGKNIAISAEPHSLSQDDKARLTDILKRFDSLIAEEKRPRLGVKDYIFNVTKG